MIVRFVTSASNAAVGGRVMQTGLSSVALQATHQTIPMPHRSSRPSKRRCRRFLGTARSVTGFLTSFTPAAQIGRKSTMRSERTDFSNIPAAGKAGIALRFEFVHHRPGLPEPGHYAPRNFLWEIDRVFVATKYRRQSAASSPPTPSSSASTFSTSSGRFGSCCSDGKHSTSRAQRS